MLRATVSKVIGDGHSLYNFAFEDNASNSCTVIRDLSALKSLHEHLLVCSEQQPPEVVPLFPVEDSPPCELLENLLNQWLQYFYEQCFVDDVFVTFMTDQPLNNAHVLFVNSLHSKVPVLKIPLCFLTVIIFSFCVAMLYLDLDTFCSKSTARI
jgi:hypothetical protein